MEGASAWGVAWTWDVAPTRACAPIVTTAILPAGAGAWR